QWNGAHAVISLRADAPRAMGRRDVRASIPIGCSMIAAPADRSRSAAAIGVALGAAVVFAIAAHVDAAGAWRMFLANLLFWAVVGLLAIDLVMRLGLQWTSTLLPGYFAVTNLYAGISAVAVAAALAPSRRDAPALDEKRARSMGALLLGFSLLWIYLFWSQYL